MATTIGLTRRDKQVFATIEDTSGTFQNPTAATFVIPAGDVQLNQERGSTNSEEVRNTLDVTEQALNSPSPGTFTVPAYIRPSGTIGTVPQGDALFQSGFGSKVTDITGAAVVGSTVDAVVTTIPFDSVTSGVDLIPPCGVITIGTEQIFYRNLTIDAADGGSFDDCVRGFNGTTAAIHAAVAGITLDSIFYKQTTACPSFTLTVQRDKLVQWLVGATVSSMDVELNKEGFTMCTFSGEGMRMYSAGYGTVGTTSAAGQKVITMTDGHEKRYTVGARIQNSTAGDDNTNGFVITAIDTTAHTITVDTNLGAEWTAAHVVEGYVPTGTEIGSPVEARYNKVLLDNTAATIRTTTLSYGATKVYVVDELGTEYPTDFADDQREITVDVNMYYRQAAAEYFKTALEGDTLAMHFGFNITADTTFTPVAGEGMVMYAPRVKVSDPQVNEEPPMIALTMTGTALGKQQTTFESAGENSLALCFV